MYEGDKQQIASLHPSLIWSRHWSKFGWKLLTFCKPVFTWNTDYFFFFKLMTNYLYLRKLFLRWGGVLGVIVCVLQNTLAIQENKYFTQMWHPCAMFPGSYSSVIFLLFSLSGFPIRLLFLCLSLMQMSQHYDWDSACKGQQGKRHSSHLGSSDATWQLSEMTVSIFELFGVSNCHWKKEISVPYMEKQ